MADKLRVEEIVATAPPVPNASPSDAEIAYGFTGGAADRPFFNKLWNRITEVLFDVQNQADLSGIELLPAVGDADDSLIYSESFNGTLGNDVINKTPEEGNSLRNDSGETNKYYFGPNSSIVRTDADLTPVYTACGEDSSLLVHRLRFSTNLNDLSAAGDRIGLSMNCTGKYERTEVFLEVVLASLGQVRFKIATYDTLGAETIVYTGPVLNADDFNQRTLTLVARPAAGSGTLEIFIPEMAYSVDTGEPMVQSTGTNDHGLCMTPNSFSANSLIIHNKDLFIVIP